MERVPQGGREQVIGVFLFGAVEARIEVLGNLDCAGNRNVLGQKAVERIRQTVHRDRAVCVEVCYIPAGMNAGIRASDTGNMNFLLQQMKNRVLHALLDGRTVFLNLPAVKICAVVGQHKSNIFHNVNLLKRVESVE